MVTGNKKKPGDDLYIRPKTWAEYRRLIEKQAERFEAQLKARKGITLDCTVIVPPYGTDSDEEE